MTNEEYINQATNEWIKLFRNKSNLNSSDIEDLKNCIKAIIETTIVWKERQMIEKACEWLKDNIHEYYQTNEFEEWFDDMFNDFKKAMEE